MPLSTSRVLTLAGCPCDLLIDLAFPVFFWAFLHLPIVCHTIVPIVNMDISCMDIQVAVLGDGQGFALYLVGKSGCSRENKCG